MLWLRVGERLEYEAKTFRRRLDAFDGLGFVLGVVLLEPLFDIIQSVPERAIEQLGDFARRCDICYLPAPSRSYPTIKASQRQMLASGQTPRRDAKELSRSATEAFFGFAAFSALATGRSKAKPGGEVFDTGPATHIRARLRNNLHDRIICQRGQVRGVFTAARRKSA